MNFKQVAVAAAVAALAVSAQASVVNWGVHSELEFGGNGAVGASSVMLDFYEFTLPEESTLTYVAITNDSGQLDLEGSILSLYSGAVGFGTLVDAIAFDAVSVIGTSFNLPIGAYYYEVQSAVSPNALAGSYTFTSKRVPEPHTIPLVLTALLAMGAAARSRSQSGR